MWNAGRQVLIAGHPRRTPFPNQVNINVNKQTYINMPGQMFNPAANCCHDSGIGTFGKVAMFLGLGSAIAGGILGAVQDGKGDIPKYTPEQQKQLEEQQKANDALKQLNEENQEQLAKLNKDKKAKVRADQNADMAARKAAAQAQQAQEVQQIEQPETPQPAIGANKVEGEKTTTTFTVKAKPIGNGKNKGHTGYNIVAGMYKGPDGKTLTHSEVQAVTRKIFDGTPLKVGDIELPNEVTVNGKTYSINPDAKQEDVRMNEYTLTHATKTFKSEAKKSGDHWIGTIDDQAIDGKYASENEAKTAAKREADRRAAEQQS